MAANKKRTNSWTTARFCDILTNVAGAYFGVSQNERISNIKIINNTVVITIEKRRDGEAHRRRQ